jgi:cytochrome d ubiquinol oxidase subunit I
MRGVLVRSRPLLWCIFLNFPLPFIAIVTGWFTAEVGRQPWTVYGVLKTADAVTPDLSVGATIGSLLLFVSIYLIIFSFGTIYIYRLLRGGPAGAGLRIDATPQRPLAVVGGSPMTARTPSVELLR